MKTSFLYIFTFLFAGTFVLAQDNNKVLLEHALKMKPVQSDTAVDVPGAEESGRCELVVTADNSQMRLLGPQKQLLRVFIDADNDEKHLVDQWSYYQNGIEVYRELDTNNNGKRDQFRWLNTAGSRWGIDEDENGVIDYWKQISAEEVSREIVLAVAAEDVQRFLRVSLSPDELKALKLGEAFTETVSGKIAKLKNGFTEAVAAVNFKNGKEAEWFQLNAVMPGIVPAGTRGLPQDLTVFENATATAGDEGGVKQITVGTLVKIGDNNWRTIDVPGLYDENRPMFTFMQPAGISNSTGPADSEVVTLMNQVQAIQSEIPSLPKEQRRELHKKVVSLLLEIIKSSSTNDERENWIRQLADTIMDATGRNEYPEGKEQIAKLFENVNKPGKEELAAHVKSRQIMTDYYIALTAGGDDMKAYTVWLEALEDLCNTFADTEAGLEGMIQLASYKEMASQTNEESIRWYTKAAEAGAAKTGNMELLAQKARGAVRRLTAEGKAVPFKAADTDNKPFDIAEYAGKYVLLVFWEQNSAGSLTLIKSVADKYESKGLVPISVDLNIRRTEASEVNWRTLYAANGLDGTLAAYWGITTPPYMILYGKDGKVLRTNIASAEELQQTLQQITQPPK
ncbi:MAG: hypothetical protein LBT89_00560 [Planctomycetaceae bacterium]|jgi:hypothetical protein|nr:hypothetical protein [Planctomycetaceae bacterium]